MLTNCPDSAMLPARVLLLLPSTGKPISLSQTLADNLLETILLTRLSGVLSPRARLVTPESDIPKLVGLLPYLSCVIMLQVTREMITRNQ